jgi:hypothetical protein
VARATQGLNICEFTAAFPCWIHVLTMALKIPSPIKSHSQADLLLYVWRLQTPFCKTRFAQPTHGPPYRQRVGSEPERFPKCPGWVDLTGIQPVGVRVSQGSRRRPWC